ITGPCGPSSMATPSTACRGSAGSAAAAEITQIASARVQRAPPPMRSHRWLRYLTLTLAPPRNNPLRLAALYPATAQDRVTGDRLDLRKEPGSVPSGDGLWLGGI